MEDMVTDDPLEADKLGKNGKRDVSEDGVLHDKEHVVKKRRLSADQDDSAEDNTTEKCDLGTALGSVDGEQASGSSAAGVRLVPDGNVNSISVIKGASVRQPCNDAGQLDGTSITKMQDIVDQKNSPGANVEALQTDNQEVIANVKTQDSIVERISVIERKANLQASLATKDAGHEQVTIIQGDKKAIQGETNFEGFLNSDTANLKNSEAVSVIKCVSSEPVCVALDNQKPVNQDIRSVEVNDCIANKKKTDFAFLDDELVDVVGKPVNSEKGVGITEFVNPIGSLNGIIKQRYSDFIVNELNVAGQIVQLASKEVPKEAACECPDVSMLLEDDVRQRLDSLQNDKNSEKVSILVDKLGKEERRKIHQFVRAKYSRLLSSTEDIENQKFIMVTHGCKDQSRQGKNRKQTSWPPDRGNYTQFVLHKENIDTMDAINIISKYLKMNPASFTYAGTKDKRAITSQLITVYRVVAEKLAGLNKVLRNIVLGNFEYAKSPLRLGDLSGNRFKIVLRKIDGNVDSINSCMISLAEKGFVNYFGMQRFGTTSIPTYHIGRALLRGDWKDAIELILKPRDADDANLAECRDLWWETRNAGAALAKLHRKNSVEGQLLYGLESHAPNDLVNAINCVPRNTRLMYTHSYQSYVWNRVVSRRLQKYQFDVIDGDLVDVCCSVERGSQAAEKQAPRVYKTSESETKPDITSIVLPLPGYDVIYPDNEIATWYREAMMEDGLDIDNMRHKVQSYSLSGSYRRMVVKPIEVSWKVVKYDDINVPLFNSDLDVLSGKREPNENQDGSLTALKMEFSLPPSSYATMALREVMKVDTSVAFQSGLK